MYKRKPITVTDHLLAATARIVDKKVAAGCDIAEVLAEGQTSPGGHYWYHPDALRPFSAAVRAAYP